jgi:glutamate racemase
VLGEGITIVDSAATTATALTDVLQEHGLRRQDGGAGRVELLATDGPERFARVGAVFLGQPLAPGDVEIVDLAFAPRPASA